MNKHSEMPGELWPALWGWFVWAQSPHIRLSELRLTQPWAHSETDAIERCPHYWKLALSVSWIRWQHLPLSSGAEEKYFRYKHTTNYRNVLYQTVKPWLWMHWPNTEMVTSSTVHRQCSSVYKLWNIKLIPQYRRLCSPVVLLLFIFVYGQHLKISNTEFQIQANKKDRRYWKLKCPNCQN